MKSLVIHRLTEPAAPELMDENSCNPPLLESFINPNQTSFIIAKTWAKSWFDSCVSNERLIGAGTGDVLYGKDAKVLELLTS